MDLALLLGLVLGVALGGVAGYALATTRQAGTIARARAAEEQIGQVEERLSGHFETLSAKALDASNQRFLELADTRLRAAGVEAAGELERRKQAVEHLVTPLRDTLAKVEEQLREVETGRRESHAMLAKQVEFVRRSSEELRAETQTLVRALQRPDARGRWGELQLRRVVELAGMTRHCDFDEQVTAQTPDGVVRPDMVVRLAGDKSIVVDSKVPLTAYLEAAASDDPRVRAAKLDAHAKHLRDHVDRLASKTYWQAFHPSPEFVVLFIPGEAFLAPALDRSPELLEYAISRRVHLATPTTLISMLRTASYAWQQAALSRNARAVFELGRELYERLGTMGGHMDELGRSLAGAVRSYNRTIGSLESRVLVSARRLNDLGVVNGTLEAPQPVTESPRPPSAAELDGRVADAHAPPGRPGSETVGFAEQVLHDPARSTTPATTGTFGPAGGHGAGDSEAEASRDSGTTGGAGAYRDLGAAGGGEAARGGGASGGIGASRDSGADGGSGALGGGRAAGGREVSGGEGAARAAGAAEGGVSRLGDRRSEEDLG
ncbi:DNA recombination protein RmuC [Thermomonospora umbrina]|uniref:DNA recombination protein RmuC n=1 Tax=Thermomonospora umbrina TaxID=111806 RepID=A0A3D9SJD8_9ACTN|nr:DNA recombination protein RmuC [Thermomonospora umbrina]REE96058.1 DNA recombination protein RmuC [Thermomonospora umbrina]